MTTATVTFKEKPILFSVPMVQAILAGRKTQTRRIMKPQPIDQGNDCWFYGDDVYISKEELASHLFHEVYGNNGTPYGSVYNGFGDRLWVRERFWQKGHSSASWDENGEWDGRWSWHQKVRFDKPVESEPVEWRCRPSIHMPRWASRINLELVDVEAEQLRDISDDDAIAEGIEPVSQLGVLRVCGWKDYSGATPGFMSPRDSFRTLWESINSDPAFSWSANPWLWVLKFKRV